ncbi:alpha-tubulin N-acetyltransferase 1-like [Scaptodrosophila lebanonensis]|uniref:Alpha-tubulin N-acetyltransferase n=1 Tax=Drosophila lebanonensis TaxID=7225 RepID=A0A6J2TVA2_DROLE|nr:alpha-tubulin N-acetyltransferase 1-like [Scaptodrosophila lebanonensis]
MADFQFSLDQLFRQPVIKITNDLLPMGTVLGRNQHCKVIAQVSEILNVMGVLSAHAQDLRSPVTTAGRVREAPNQYVYLLANVRRGRRGQVCGMLKVGLKQLFLFDVNGAMRNVSQAPSILDFYVHESCQRTGQGKRLFEYMLADMGWSAVQCAIDRPSGKMAGFMNKHYQLERSVPQSNHFVIYQGFFEANHILVNSKPAQRQLQLRNVRNGGGDSETDDQQLPYPWGSPRRRKF